LDLQENIYKKVMKTYYVHVGGRGFGDSSIDVFLESPDKRYSQILYLIDYIAHGLHLGSKMQIFKEMC
jgi:hypothetical protein